MIEPQPSRGAAEGRVSLQRFAHDAMACTFEVCTVGEDEKYARQAVEAAFKETDRLEAELSRFVPTSDVAHINALRAGQRTRVGIEVIECLQLAAQLHAQTNGAFDVTVGSKGAAAPPRQAVPLELDPKGRYVGVRLDGVRIDLGGIGKGYAVDQIATVLREWGIGAALIHSGQSTVFALGRPAAGETWSVAARDPRNHGDVLGHVQLHDAALSGSGRKLHGDHIIDPRTGRAVTNKLGAWALAPSAALADALSSAFFVMSPSEIEAHCGAHAEVAGLICVERRGETELRHFGKSLAR